MVNFEDLMSRSILPIDCKSIKLEAARKKCLTLSQASKLTLAERKGKMVICDDAKWVAKSENGLYSCDGEFVYKLDKHRTSLGVFIAKDRLILSDTINLNEEKLTINNFKEVHKMNNGHLGNADELSKAIEEVGMELGQGIGESMAFTVDAGESITNKDLDKENKIQRRKDVLKTISSNINGVKLADTAVLHAWNSELATIIGWITNSDARLRAFVKSKKRIDKETKQPVFKPNVSAAIRAEVQAGNSVDNSYYVYDSNIEFKINAPGPAKLAAIKMPLSGLVDIETLRDASQPIKIDKDNKDFRTMFFSKDQLINFMSGYIGKHIKEDPATHDNPGVLTVKRIFSSTTDKATGNIIRNARVSMKVEGKSLIQSRNYFPLSVYKTVSLAELAKADAKTLEQANYSLFHGIFNNSQDGRGYDNLPADQKALVTKDAEGNIVSKYLDKTAGVAIQVNDWATKEAVANLQIPLKKRNTKGDKVTYQFLKYDVLKGGDELKELDPFQDERFADFRKACGDALNVADIRKALGKDKKKASKTSSTVELTDEEAFKMFLASASEDGLSNIAADKSLNGDLVRDLGTEIATVIARSRMDG